MLLRLIICLTRLSLLGTKLIWQHSEAKMVYLRSIKLKANGYTAIDTFPVTTDCAIT
jgi:hypothetical protein